MLVFPPNLTVNKASGHLGSSQIAGLPWPCSIGGVDFYESLNRLK